MNFITMKRIYYFLVFAVILSAGVYFLHGAEAPVCESPDGLTMVSFERLDGGRMVYSVERDGKTIIKSSKLGLETREENLSEGFEIDDIDYASVEEKWTQPWGENKEMTDHHNEFAVNLSNSEGTHLTIRFRAFNDGVAFRYEVKSEKEQLTLTGEKTEFNFAGEGTSWSIPANFETYELDYRKLPLSEVADGNTPFTFRMDNGTFGSIHEAALYDYPEMTLRRNDDGVMQADLAPMPDGTKGIVKGEFKTPWRTIQIGDAAVDLINSSMILNLNEPSKIADTSWIKPQKYVGVWWGMHIGVQTWVMGRQHGATTENALRHIDFAVENNIQGVLFEGWNCGWENWGGSQSFDYMKPYADFDVERIVAYAREKGVELWMHNETGGNIPEYEAVMDKAMAQYAAWGVHALKTGYAGGFKDGYRHHSQYGVQHYQRVVECAAKHQLMIDAHEPIKDTGIRRTWPNMMTREGARGMEWNAWSEGNTADYLCTLPFVRLLGGPMDYTPGIFDLDYNRAKADKNRIQWNGDNSKCCIKTTLARQIANWVIIYSPLQMAADLIENYEEHPAFEFFRQFDADCDWSEALAGEIGEYIVVARRAGDRFFVGAGTNSEAREVDVKLDFLKQGERYEAVIYGDDVKSDDRNDYIIERRVVTADDTLHIAMAEAGGCAVTLIPKAE